MGDRYVIDYKLGKYNKKQIIITVDFRISYYNNVVCFIIVDGSYHVGVVI